MQSVDDALAVLKRQVDGGVHVRTDGVVVVVLRWVEFVGEVRNAHAQLEGQLAVFVGNDGEVDVGIERKYVSQLLGNAVVAETGIIEGEADRRVVVQHFPTVLTIGIMVQRQLVGWCVHAIASQSAVELVVLEIQVAEMRPRLKFIILVVRLGFR